jgi:hypothetical protein
MVEPGSEQRAAENRRRAKSSGGLRSGVREPAAEPDHDLTKGLFKGSNIPKGKLGAKILQGFPSQMLGRISMGETSPVAGDRDHSGRHDRADSNVGGANETRRANKYCVPRSPIISLYQAVLHANITGDPRLKLEHNFP